MQIPENGVNSYFGDTTNMIRLFNTLADGDAISIISYLGASVRNKMFSAAMISDKLGIPPEDAILHSDSRSRCENAMYCVSYYYLLQSI